MERFNKVFSLCNEVREQVKDIAKTASLAEDVHLSLEAIKSYPPEQTISVALAQTSVKLTRDEAIRLMQNKMNDCTAELAKIEIALTKVKDVLNGTLTG